MDKLQHENRIPPSAVKQLRRLCGSLTESLSTLGGVILHGSAASAGFEPDRSDLDVLAIVDSDPEEQELAHLGEAVIAISGEPHPLEISIVSRQALLDWRHPCPHLLHFGEDIRERYESGLFMPLSPTDEDLTMHIVVARARGINLTGMFQVSDLPVIPRSDFLAAILSDFEWAKNQEEDLSEYTLSNACRTLAYLRDELILSKSEGRQWCADRGIDEASAVANVVQELKRIVAS